MLYYVFRSGSDLICFIHTEETPPTLQDNKNLCFSRQMDFYGMLTEEDTRRFTSFCRSKPKSAPSSVIPSLLLFPHTAYASVFAERYTSQLLAAGDPIPGAIAAALGQSPMHMLRKRFPSNHLILTRLFRTVSDLYSANSPILAFVPRTVRSLLSELEQTSSPHPVAGQTTPCLLAYHTERHSTDAPTILDLYSLLSRLIPALTDSLMFSGLHLDYHPALSPVAPEESQIRFPISAFLYIFVLLSYMMAVLSDRESAAVELYREDPYLCLTLFCETDRIPLLYSTRCELHSLTCLFPEYTGILTLLQYLLHRHYIPFTCRSQTRRDWPGLEFTLYLDTRFREEIEFRHADMDARLADTLPDALSLLHLLTGLPPSDPLANPPII